MLCSSFLTYFKENKNDTAFLSGSKLFSFVSFAGKSFYISTALVRFKHLKKWQLKYEMTYLQQGQSSQFATFQKGVMTFVIFSTMILAIALVSKCSVLENGNKLHHHMEWDKSNRPFSFC